MQCRCALTPAAQGAAAHSSKLDKFSLYYVRGQYDAVKLPSALPLGSGITWISELIFVKSNVTVIKSSILTSS
jgi:hypothetical protein